MFSVVPAQNSTNLVGADIVDVIEHDITAAANRQRL